ncbi:hypothetical protein ACJX0J_008351 [Zea mays]
MRYNFYNELILIKNMIIYPKKKVFLWLDNLRKRYCHGPIDCVFHGIVESVDHLFFKCPVARYVNIDDLFGDWMNDCCFDDKTLYDLSNVAIWTQRCAVVVR